MNKYKIRQYINDKSVFLLILMLILAVMYILAASGCMLRANKAVAQLEKVFLGYSDRVYEVVPKDLEALPIVDGYIEQSINMGEEISENETLMLGFLMATYERKNVGKLYVELIQENETEVFEIDMENIADNEECRLIFHTEKFHSGELKVKIYSDDSTWENCVALYAANNLDTYEALCVSGEKTGKNAVIQVYIPSIFAKSDFE